MADHRALSTEMAASGVRAAPQSAKRFGRILQKSTTPAVDATERPKSTGSGHPSGRVSAATTGRCGLGRPVLVNVQATQRPSQRAQSVACDAVAQSVEMSAA